MLYDHAVALTGGIATGKSSAVAIFSDLGFTVIDADTIAHEVLHGQMDAIAKLFGSHYCTPDGVDRAALGLLVFGQPEQREKLEALLHPLIREEVAEQAKVQEKLGKPYIIDIPLFFESKKPYPIERSIVVYASREQQLMRLMMRDAFTEVEAWQRINAQMDIEEKRKRATYIIYNSGDPDQLRSECKCVVAQLQEQFSIILK